MSDQDQKGLLQGLCEKDARMKASEELKSRLIASYEQAVHNGLAPCSTLAVMQEWVSEMCAHPPGPGMILRIGGAHIAPGLPLAPSV